MHCETYGNTFIMTQEAHKKNHLERYIQFPSHKIKVISKITLLHQSHSRKYTHMNHLIIQFTEIILNFQNVYYKNFFNIYLYRYHNTNNSNHKSIYLIQHFHPYTLNNYLTNQIFFLLQQP